LLGCSIDLGEMQLQQSLRCLHLVYTMARCSPQVVALSILTSFKIILIISTSMMVMEDGGCGAGYFFYIYFSFLTRHVFLFLLHYLQPISAEEQVARFLTLFLYVCVRLCLRVGLHFLRRNASVIKMCVLMSRSKAI